MKTQNKFLASILFLVQRGLGTGITIYAPSIILSTILGWNLTQLNIIIGSLVIIYTFSGGTKAVNVTQKHQMFVIMFGMILTFFLILHLLPNDMTFGNALHIAGANDKMNIVDFSFDPETRYTFWSGITGGFFLALSYFGTDQSQVGRYLSGKSIKESQMGLIMNGFLKVPMQFFILLIGVMVFVFFQFNPVPLNFNPNNKIVKMFISAAPSDREATSPIPPCGSCRQSISEYEVKQELTIDDLSFMDALKSTHGLLFVNGLEYIFFQESSVPSTIDSVRPNVYRQLSLTEKNFHPRALARRARTCSSP